MELKELRSFSAVVKYGSFTKAAEHLYISQPTISTHIRMLEKKLGRQLIRRTTKNIELTQKGQEIYEYVSSIIELCDRISAACRSEERRIIQLGASTIPSSYILPEVLPEFGSIYPDIYFVIHQSDSQKVIDGLLDGIFDMGLTGMDAKSEALCSKPFYYDKLILITPVTPRFIQMQRLKQTPLDELLKEPIILREKGSGTNKSASQYLERIGVSDKELNVTARINDQEAIKNLVAGGLGISIISDKAAKNFILEKRLLKFDLPDSGTRKLYLVWRNGAALSLPLRNFKSFMINKYKDCFGGGSDENRLCSEGCGKSAALREK